MTEQHRGQISAEQGEQVVKILGEIADRSRHLVEDFLERHKDLRNDKGHTPGLDGHALGRPFPELLQRWMAQPGELLQAQFQLWQDYVRLWHPTAQRMMGQEVEPVIAPDRS